MAAKLEQPVQPSYERMVRLVEKIWGFKMTLQNLYDLEETIIVALDFNLRHLNPLLFLDRYLKFYNLDP